MTDRTRAWTPDEVARLDEASELDIAVRAPDGTLREPLPIWVVTVGGQAYVRTWRRRETGWFGRVLRTGRAQVRVPGLEADVVVQDVGAADAVLRAAVDDAFRTAYGRPSVAAVADMVTDDAAAATLRLVPEVI